ncbi:hypothetical protein [uncultured Microbacterium sp.]|uniref:hypothetical protein n=1 Tax=uncultured Microbacterium sp. TaxID=191216 RepID=UPI0025EBFD75|nr:hypothetical protein [uncultured Microbacterium sp.]
MALTIGVLIPLIVSLFAVLKLRDLRCTDGFAYTFAPLLVTCGERQQAVLVVGWALTTATLAGLIVAAIAAITGLISSRSGGWALASAVAGVVVVTLLVLASNPDATWGTNSWIFFSAAGSAIVVGVAAIGSRIARTTENKNRSSG